MIKFLYFIWGNHWRVLYNGIEYDMQILNYSGKISKDIEILLIYRYNNQNHILAKFLWF